MNESKPLPSRSRPSLAGIARWALAAMLAMWLAVIALGIGLHGFIVPRIGDWRGQIEGWVSQAIGAPVRIDAITARSEGIVPTIELQSLQLLDGQGHVALVVPKVVLGVSVRSLLRGGVEQLYVEGAQLDVRRDQSGMWHVAGVPLASKQRGDGAGLEWLLAQPEVVVRHSSIWVQDAYLQAPNFGLEDVNLLLRGGVWRHAWHLSAIPVRQGGVVGTGAKPQKLEVTGLFRPALLSSAATWQRWSGQLYARLDVAQLPALPWPQTWPVQQLQVQGDARIWLDVQRGVLVGVTADAALPSVAVDWRDSDAQPLLLDSVAGRFQAQRHSGAWAVQVKQGTFRTPQGPLWEPSDVMYRPLPLPGATQGHELVIGRADIQMLCDLAQRVPGLLPWQAVVQQWTPSGVLEDVQLRYLPQHYQLKGRISSFSVQAQPSELGGVGIPGVAGLSGSFALTEKGGEAKLSIVDGSMEFPGIFAQPQVPLEHLKAKVRWQQEASQLKVQVTDADFHNADARGSLIATWHTGASPAQRFPGVLQLEGVLHEANGARVFRYLPLQVAASARDYVRDSVKSGTATGVRFEVTGDLQQMPFRGAEAGRFYIEAPLRDVVYDYVPQTLAGGRALWPGLSQLQGTLVFDGLSMEVRNARTAFQGVKGLMVQEVHARIEDLTRPRVQVQALGAAPVHSMLDFVRQSPVQGWTGHALAQAKAQGRGELRLELDLPIFELHRSEVQGALTLRGNSLHLGDGIPALQALQGQVAFSHQGFALEGVRGQGLGGELSVTGGLGVGSQEVHIQAQGIATAKGLQAAPWPVLEQVAQHAQGQAAYAVDVRVASGLTEVQVQSPLEGMSLDLPEPLRKAAHTVWPLQVTVRQTPEGLQSHRVDVGDTVHVAYEWENAAKAPRGLVRVGHFAQAPALPPFGVAAALALPALDVDAWQAFLSQRTGWAANVTSDAGEDGAARFVPQQVSVDVGQLHWQQRSLGAVKAEAAYRRGHWSGSVQAPAVGGKVDFYPADAQYPGGRVFARLTHLIFPKSEVERLEQAGHVEPGRAIETLPALDIRVEDVQLAGLHLGGLDLLAINRVEAGQREWWLERFDVTLPEATWRAHGRWAADDSLDVRERATSLTFTLDIRDAGKLLQRFRLPDVVAGGQGHMGGLVQWVGTPLSPDRASMQGQVQLEMGQGQFLKVEPGAGKLLSVLSLQSLSRRAVLDFRDVFGQGFAFDFVRGDVQIREGVAMTQNLQMKGLNAAVRMEGQAHLVHETQDLRVVVVPEINAMTASLAASVINPVVGLGTFLAQMVLRGPVMAAATRVFHVHGSWTGPAVERIKMPEASPAVAP